MRKFMRPLVAIVLALLHAELLYAQDSIPWPAADRLTVTIQASVATTASGVLSIEYRLFNAIASEQPAQAFAVRTFVPADQLDEPRLWMHLAGVMQDSAAVFWFAATTDAPVVPGNEMRGFTYSASGWPDIVSYRVQGTYELPVAEEGDFVQRPPSFWVNSVAGFTVGVVPPPADQSPPSLGVRLRSLLLRVCNLGWITSDGVCRSLQVKLDQATQSIAGNRPSARGQLRAFLDELEAQHGTEPGKHVTDSAYGLLKINAQYLLSGL